MRAFLIAVLLAASACAQDIQVSQHSVNGSGATGNCVTWGGPNKLGDSGNPCTGGSAGAGWAGYSAIGLSFSGTQYFPPLGGGTPSSTESNVDAEAPSAATVTNFYAVLSGAPGAGNSVALTFRNNTADTAVTCTVSGASATDCHDITHSFTTVAQDKIDLKVVTTGTIVGTLNLMFVYQVGTTGGNGTVNTGTLGQTAYYAANGSTVSGHTVTNGQLQKGSTTTGTADADLTGDCTTSGTVAITCTKSGGVNLSFWATATGAINAQTGTYQVLAGDFSNAKVISVASGTFTITLVASGSQPANGQYIWVVNYGSGVVTIARSGQNINGGTASMSLPASSATAPTSAVIFSDGSNYFAALANTTGGSGGTSTTAVGTASYGSIQMGSGGDILCSIFGQSQGSTSCNSSTGWARSSIMGFAGTITAFCVSLGDVAQPGTGSLVATIQKSTTASGTQPSFSNTTAAVTFAASAVAYTKTCVTVSPGVAFAQGDMLAIDFHNNATSASAFINNWSMTYTIP